MTKFNKDDKRELEKLEGKLDRSQAFELEAAYALRDICDKKLYRLRYNTFESYCRSRWDMSVQSAQQLIQAADVMDVIAGSGRDFRRVPSNVSQAVLLGVGLRSNGRGRRIDDSGKQEVIAAWDEVLRLNPKSITCRAIRGVVISRRPTPRAKGRPRTGAAVSGVYIGPSVEVSEAAIRLCRIYTQEQIDELIGELLTASRKGLQKAA